MLQMVNVTAAKTLPTVAKGPGGIKHRAYKEHDVPKLPHPIIASAHCTQYGDDNVPRLSVM